MVTILSLVLFGAAFAATVFVMASTLAPALPRIVSLLTDGVYANPPEPAFVARRERTQPIIRRQAVVATWATRAAA